jgi:endonuclease/exonuclease/phosphatase family metal-dependent hydrolase
VINGHLQRLIHPFFGKLARFDTVVAGVALAIGASGCASHRPAPLLVERQAMAAPTSRMETGFSLKLVTYNVWGLPSWMTGAQRGRYPQIARELERLDPDFILLQEAWTAKARKAAPADGRWALARAAGQHTFFQQSGLVTLSKCPILGGEFYPFSHAAYLDRFVNKGVLKVTVQLPGGQVLNVWNVHLQEGRWLETRRSQVRELVARVRAAEDGQIADVVGGDFNCTPESPLGQELARSLGASVVQLGGAEPFVTWDGLSTRPGAGKKIDYIFVRERAIFQDLQAVPRVVFAAARPEQRLSDHLGIEAVVNLSPAIALAGAVRPLPEGIPLPTVAADRVPWSEPWLGEESAAALGPEFSAQGREGAGD